MGFSGRPLRVRPRGLPCIGPLIVLFRVSENPKVDPAFTVPPSVGFLSALGACLAACSPCRLPVGASLDSPTEGDYGPPLPATQRDERRACHATERRLSKPRGCRLLHSASTAGRARPPAPGEAPKAAKIRTITTAIASGRRRAAAAVQGARGEPSAGARRGGGRDPRRRCPRTAAAGARARRRRRGRAR